MWREFKLAREEVRELDHVRHRRPKYLLDENVDSGMRPFLVGRGFNVLDVGDLGLRGRDDVEIYAAARREDRVLITGDQDFLSDSRFPPAGHPGLIVLRVAPGASSDFDLALRNLTETVGVGAELIKSFKIVIEGGGELRIWSEGDTGGRVLGRWKRDMHGRIFYWEVGPQ